MRKTCHWAELGWQDFQARDMARVIAVLPVAAIEQHGPHLPVGTDAMIMQGYLERVVDRLPQDLEALFLPMLQVGSSPEHVEFPGTLTFPPDLLLRIVAELGASVARTGCRKIVLLNSHGGNSAVLDIAARELRRAHRMLATPVSWGRFGYPDGMFSESERVHGIHGGDIETSLMMAFRPDLVRAEAVADFPPASFAMEREFNWLSAGRPVGFGWMAQDLSDTGAMGNAALASREKGEACADYGATAFIELLRDLEAFDLAALPDGPSPSS